MTELKPPYWEHTTKLNRSCYIFHAADQRGGLEDVLWWITKYDDGVWRLEVTDDYPGVYMSAVDMACLGQGLAMLAHGDKPTGVWLT